MRWLPGHPRFHQRRHAQVIRESEATRAAMDDLWRAPYETAIRDIVWSVQTDSDWAFIRLPFPFDTEQHRQSERVMRLAHRHGYALRPGGPAGPAADIIRLERPID
jgi:hypothetical protein